MSLSLKKEIEALVGPSFRMLDRWRMKGIGSPRLLIHEASTDIKELLDVSADLNYCNVELRPQGIIIRFRSRLETYGLIIPYYRLAFYQNGTSWSFHSEGLFLKVTSTLASEANDRFKMTLLQQKQLCLGDYGPAAMMN
jgi:hypothetical protein